MRDRFLACSVWLVRSVPWLVLLLAALATGAAGWVGWNPELRSSQLDMIPRDNPVVKHWTDFTDDFDTLADLFVVVRSRDLGVAKRLAVELEKELGAFPKLVRGTEYRLDPKLYEEQGLYFLPLEDVKSMEKRVREQKPDLLMLSRSPGFTGLAKVFQYELNREVQADPQDVLDFFHFIRDVAKRLGDVAGTGHGEDVPWRAFFGMADTAGNADDPFADGGWKVSVKKDALLVAIHPADSSDDFDFIVPFFETCHGVIDRLKTKYPGVEIGMTGQPASIYFQRDVVGKDLELTSLVSLVLVFIVVVWGFRGLGLPFLAMVSLVCAIVWTFGALHFSPGHLNLITTAFVSMLLGLGADYGIYVLSQFAERRRADGEYFESIRGAVLAAGPGILTGAFTTCAGFFTLMLTDFPGFRELGQIAGVGILLCMLAMLVLLPCLLASAGRLTRSLGAGVTGLTERVLGATATFALENSLPVLVAFGIGSFVLLVEGFNTEFDYNLLNMEPENTEPVVYEHVLQKDFEITPDTVMVTTKTLDEASEKKKQLEKLASVGNVDSLTNYIPSRPEEKQAVLSRIASEVHGVRFDKPSAVDVDSLAASLDAVRKKLKELKLGLLMAYGGEHVLAAADGEENLQRALEAMRKGPKGEVGRRLTAYQEASFRDLSGGFEGFRRLLTARPFRLEQLPEAIRARYRGKSGRYVLFVSPRVDVRLESQAKLFIAQTGAVSPGVTGVPILIDEVMTLLRRGFKQATAYSLIAVILLVFFDFRTMKETLLALTPLVVSLSATVGLMALTGTKFNPANFVSIPILTGLGMAYGVYLLHRLRQDPEAGPVGAVRTTGRSILLSCLTSLAGFGSLMLARNRGLHSLGRILVGGLGICLLASLVMLPTLAELVGYRGRRPREDEAPLRDSLLGFHV